MDKSSKPTPRPNPSDVQKTVQQPVDQTGASASDPDLSDVQKTVQQPVGQSSTSAPSSNVSGSQTIIQPSPVNPSAASLPKSDPPDPPAERYTRARIFLIFLLLSLNLVFFTNPFVVSTLTIIIGILQVFGDTLAPILKYTDKVFAPLLDFFEWIWRFFFFKPLPYLGRRLIRHRRSIIDIAIIIAIICFLGATTLNPFVRAVGSNLSDSVCLYTHLPWFSCNSGIGVSTLPNGVRIGLIANDTYGPFDQSALNQDEIEIEKLIFQENQQACTDQHITLIVATMLSRTVGDPLSTVDHSLQGLQGSYLAQHTYNATPHPAARICLAIANLGTPDTASEESTLVKSHPDDYSLPQVIHQIAQFAHTDSSFRGIVGFRYSQTAKEALDLIKGYQDLSTIPVISPSASSDDLSNIANFYRIVSPDHSQGAALAQFFCDSLLQNQSSDSIAMLTDPSSAYSNSLQLAFNNALKCGDARHRTTITYTNYDTGSIQQAVDKALSDQQVKYIFFPGYDTDMNTVELEIHKVSPDHARDITILGGDGINNVDATTYYAYNRVYATAFAGPLPDNNPIATSATVLGFSQSPALHAIPSYLWIRANTLLDYDAVNAFAETIKKVSSGALSQDNFNKALRTIVFDGASGPVHLQGSSNNDHRSDRNQGYVYITCNDLAHSTHLIAGYSAVNDGTSSPQNLHLGKDDGVSSCS
jgi:hypothetical protein